MCEGTVLGYVISYPSSSVALVKKTLTCGPPLPPPARVQKESTNRVHFNDGVRLLSKSQLKVTPDFFTTVSQECKTQKNTLA